jgi:hypothetical protein
MNVLPMRPLTILWFAVALSACTTTNTGYPQPASRGGGWENFRAGVPGPTIEAAARTAATELCEHRQ